MNVWLFASIIISLITYSIQKDWTYSFQNHTIKVLGKSGKMELSNINEEGETNSVVMTFSSLKEKSAEGKDVGAGAVVKHQFENFAQLDFTIEDFVSQKYQNLSVYSCKFSASISDTNETFGGSFIFFVEGGEIKNIDDKYIVKPGSVKFSFTVQGWNFCKLNVAEDSKNFCNEEEGKYLDFELEIRGKRDAVRKNALLYDLGESSFILSSFVEADNKILKLPDGYPSLIKQGNKDIFSFRLPTFEDHVSYDPVITIEKSLPPPNTWMVIGVIVGIVAIIVVIFLVLRCFQNSRKEEALMP